jgi:UDP-N-acetylglucosamine--N-acetylmuramyl-(pentapeptide) pyrophosphoryl-undecaprenol N-acetylglucosamine transferase
LVEDMAGTVLIAASGTGGHLLPALYIASALQEADPDLKIAFVGAGTPLEEKLIDGRGYPRYVVLSRKLRRMGVRGVVSWILHLPAGLVQAWSLLARLQPGVVIGVGGYASVLPVMVGTLRGVRTWIHEAERRPGWANWLLSMVATKCSLSFSDAVMPVWAKTVITGQPLRPELVSVPFLPIPPEQRRTIFITGGSQGARALDEAGIELAPFFAERGFSVRHQCRPESVERVKSAYERAGVDATVVTFIESMTEVYQWASVVISRSGLGMMRELRFTGRPTILVPLPGAEEQQYNAQLLVERGQGVVCPEGAAFSNRLQAHLEEMLSPQGYEQFCKAAGEGSDDAAAAARIAKGVLELLRQRR